MVTDHVHREFQAHSEAIDELRRTSPTFRDMCRDYEDIRTWLDEHCGPERRASTECVEALKTARGLEAEIGALLQAYAQRIALDRRGTTDPVSEKGDENP